MTDPVDARLAGGFDHDAAERLIDSLAPPRETRKELVIDQSTGRVRQAGAASAEGAQVLAWRERAERDLFFFLRTICNMHWLHPPLHLPVCRWVQRVPPRSKALMMPRNHCKCQRKSDFDRKTARYLAVTVTDSGKARLSSYKTQDNGRHLVYRVTTHSGRSIEVTSNHPFFTWNGWKTLDEGLAAGMWVGVVRRGLFGEQHNPALAEAVGWMLADANLPSQVLSANDADERQRFIALTRAAGFDAHETPGTPNAVRVLGMRRWWDEQGLLETLSAQKFIPPFVLHGDEATVRAFLRGLFHDATAYGGRTRDGIVYTTTSEQLANDVQHVLTKFGLHSLLRRQVDRVGQHRPLDYVWYTVAFTDRAQLFVQESNETIGTTWDDRFPPEWRDELGPGDKGRLRKAGVRIDNHYATSRTKLRCVAELLGNKRLQQAVDADIAWEPIISIEPLGEDDTICVETPEHTLTAGDIITHNSTIVAQGVPLHALIQPREHNLYFPGTPGANTRILMVGEAEDRIADHYRPIKQALEGNELLRAMWPHIMWASPKTQAPLWNNTELIVKREDNYPDPSIRAIGVGGATTGSHPNLMVKDDLTTEKAMNEPPTMAKAIEWNRNSRALFEDPLKSVEFFTFTRWSVTDLAADIESDATVAMNTRWRQLIEDGTVIYPSKFGDDPELISKLLIEKHGFVMYALQYMNSVIQSGLTDFSEEDLRLFRLVGDALEFDDADADDRLAQEVHRVTPSAPKPASLKELQSLRGLSINDPRVIDATRMRYLREVRGG